jgi:hypothetical protein
MSLTRFRRFHNAEYLKAAKIAEALGLSAMSPLANSYNALGLNNQQPEYQCLWAPMGVNQASAVTAITYPAAAGAGAWVPGALVSIIAAGVGTNPGPGGDDDGATNWTAASVDLAAVSATTFLAGVILGFGALGSFLQAAPNTFAPSQVGPNLTCMVGTKGICQVLCDNTTTVGHTLNVSSTSLHTGQVSDSGGTSATLMSTIGVALQAVTVSTGPKLVWAKIDVAYSV